MKRFFSAQKYLAWCKLYGFEPRYWMCDYDGCEMDRDNMLITKDKAVIECYRPWSAKAS